MNDMELLQKQQELLRQQIDFALVAIIESENCTRTRGQMIVLMDKTVFGSCGGGNIERRIIADAVRSLAGNRSAVKTYDAADCGGAEADGCGGRMTVSISVFCPRSQLLMIGGGHVGAALMRAAAFVGFQVILVDNREEGDLAPGAREAAEQFIRVEDYQREVAALDQAQGAYIVIATSKHETDGQALLGALSLKPRYLGMIGGSHKIKQLFDLAREQGVSEEELQTVHTPVGLNIGGETPPEIAISIMAEILSVKYGRDGHSWMGREKK